MITKKLLWGLLVAATLFSTSTYAFYHAHSFQPRIKFYHHHPRTWRNIHRWQPYHNEIVVRNVSPYSRFHHHY